MSIFIDSESQEIYEKIIDERIEEYNDQMEEVSKLEENLKANPEIFEGMIEFAKGFNFLDTRETTLFKLAKKEKVPIVYLTKNGESYFDLDVDDFESEEDLKQIWKDLELLPEVTFKDYLDFILYNRKDEELMERVSIVVSIIDPEDYLDINYWEDRIEKYLIRDENIREEIYARQLQLLTNSIHPNIRNAKFQTKSRRISFDVFEMERSITTSIYDKFIFKNPSNTVPYMKLYNMDKDETYKVYTRVSRKDINDWICLEENIEKNSPFRSTEPYIYFLFRWYEEKNNTCIFSECYLSSSKIYIKVPSNYDVETISSIFMSKLDDFFDIGIENPREESVEVEATLNDFFKIELNYLQYYLISSGNMPIKINEINNEVSSGSRKIRFNSNFYINNIEPLVIEYERSSAEKLLIKAPGEDIAKNFFNDIFGRFIHGYYLRQHAIRVMMHRIVENPASFVEVVKQNKSKKKKDTFVSQPHLFVKKKKLDQIKELVKSIKNNKSYGRTVQCKNQPVVFTEKEAKAWLNVRRTVFSKPGESMKREIKVYETSDGRKLHFACVNEKWPVIHLVGEQKKDQDSYIFYPRCLAKKRTYNDEDIRIVEDDEDEAEPLQTAKVFNDDNIDEDDLGKPSIDRRSYLTLELKHILSYVMEVQSRNLKLIYPTTKTTNCMALNILSIVLSKEKLSIPALRNKIADSTVPLLLSQEATALEIKPEVLVESFRDVQTLVDTEVFVRMLEEYFDVHIFVFRIKYGENKKKKIWEQNSKIEMEVPLNKIFYARSLKKDRKCVVLLRTMDTSDYAIVSDTRNKSVFGPEVTRRLMEMYYEINKYNIEKEDLIYKNLYSKYYWQEFIPNDPIVAQDIDIVGKCRIIQTQSGFTIQIPPSEPFNVPLISENVSRSLEEIIEKFGNPSFKDEFGVYYSYHGIPNMIYILCNNPEELDNDEKMEIPMSLFEKEDRIDVEILKFRLLKRATFAFVQILQWGWSVSRRPDFENWIRDYISFISEPSDPYDVIPENILTYLPVTNDPRVGFQIVHRWWPEIFTSNGNIMMWRSLYDRILRFFKNEERIMGRYVRTNEVPIQGLIGFYDSPDDYSAPQTVRIFDSKQSFCQWHRKDRLKEENPNIVVSEINSFSDIKDLLCRKNFVRIRVKNHYFVIKNFEKNTRESIISEIIKIREIDDSKPVGVQVFAFSKTFDVILVEDTEIEPKIQVLMYPTGSYAMISY